MALEETWTICLIKHLQFRWVDLEKEYEKLNYVGASYKWCAPKVNIEASTI